MRHLLAGLLEEERVAAVVDMEAGLEHLSRGTARHVDTLLVVLEPYFKALETAHRCAELGRELEVPRVLGIANKIRSAQDRSAVLAYAEAHSIPIAAAVPFDGGIQRADLAGEPPSLDGRGPAAKAIEELAGALGL